jgi:hypothetical protein
VNRFRAAKSWTGEYSDKMASEFDGKYGTIQSNKDSYNSNSWFGNLSNILNVKKNRKCNEFSSFIHRFKSVYIGGGIIPERVFHIGAVPFNRGLYIPSESSDGATSSDSNAATASDPVESLDALKSDIDPTDPNLCFGPEKFSAKALKKNNIDRSTLHNLSFNSILNGLDWCLQYANLILKTIKYLILYSQPIS